MYKVISLYSGAGGLDLGIQAAGFQIAAAVEFDSDAVRTMELAENEAWWHATKLFPELIQNVSSKAILRGAGLRKRDVALLIGGPPCQPFSKSGYWHSGESKRLADPRAETLSEYFRVLEDTLPEAFLLENVPGLAFSDKDEGLQFLKKSVSDINARQKTNYQIYASQLNAVEYGVPQARERVFVIAHRNGKPFRFPDATHTKPSPVDMSSGIVRAPSQTPQGGKKDFLTAWDAIGHLSGQNDPELGVKGKWADLLPSIPEGHNYLYHTNRGKGLAIFGWRRRYWSMLLKLAKNRPSWTLTAQPGPAIGPFHWENRRLSGEELCALQTFPANYKISGNVMAAHKQIGNAVPSALAELLGTEIKSQFFGERETKKSLSLLPKKNKVTEQPAKVLPVPDKYLELVGEHEAHPGTGRGPGAKRRINAT